MSGLSKNKIKWIRSLHLKKFRDENDLYIVEGEKMVLEAIHYVPETIELLVHTEDFHISKTAFETIQITLSELAQVSTLKNPNKALVVLKKPTRKKLNDLTGLILALDGIQDPGNMGTILRIADWYGIDSIVCSKNTVECFNPKVVQSSMGAIFRVNVFYTSLKEWLSQVNIPVYGALLEGVNVYESNLEPTGILLLGNEGNGISEDLKPHITNPITIPRFGAAESLNVSIAAGILVSEFKRK